MCDKETLQKLTPLRQVRECAFLLLNCRDLPTLVEASRFDIDGFRFFLNYSFRLLSLVSQSSFWTAEWETSFEDFGTYDDVMFVLSSSSSSTILELQRKNNANI